MSQRRDGGGSEEGGRALSYLQRQGEGDNRSIKGVKYISVKSVSTLHLKLLCCSKLEVLQREGLPGMDIYKEKKEQ